MESQLIPDLFDHGDREDRKANRSRPSTSFRRWVMFDRIAICFVDAGITRN